MVVNVWRTYLVLGETPVLVFALAGLNALAFISDLLQTMLERLVFIAKARHFGLGGVGEGITGGIPRHGGRKDGERGNRDEGLNHRRGWVRVARG
jgi:hypothetical protein